MDGSGEQKGIAIIMDGCCRDCKHYEECELWCDHREHFELCNEPSCSSCKYNKRWEEEHES